MRALGFGPRLELRQSQSLVMTPQLQQAIKLLQLSSLEVQAYVDAELERNPLLDSEGAADGAPREEGAAAAPVAEGDPAPLDTRSATDLAASMPAERVDVDSGEWDEAGPRAFENWGRGGDRPEDDEGGGGPNLARPPTLREHLLEQIAIDLHDPVDRFIARHLVDSVDEAGYLSADLDHLAAVLKCPVARIEQTIERVQRFDPPGVFARSLRECLALQLRELGKLDPAMTVLIDNLELLARRDLARLTRVCGVNHECIARMVTDIRALDPKPGLAFDPPLAPPVIPDVIVRPAPGEQWIVELNQDALPRVLVNHRYHARICRDARSKRDKEFIAEQLQSANWLVKSLHQRANTILKVSTEIVRQQDGFFRQGVQQLRPLILRDIAAAIGMHESTVSRVTTNKYLSAPQGVFELKYFFTSAIQGAPGSEQHSAEAVRFRIKTLIEAEAEAEVLSDDRIVEILRRDGVDIARRTVAKYREALRIPSSVQRRRDKVLGL